MTVIVLKHINENLDYIMFYQDIAVNIYISVAISILFFKTKRKLSNLPLITNLSDQFCFVFNFLVFVRAWNDIK